jgi:hypothetical protein
VLATLGMPFPSPGSIIFTFLFMVILFMEVGNLIDKLLFKRLAGLDSMIFSATVTLLRQCLLM